jgi:predicted dinucleotide-binding enzyme
MKFGTIGAGEVAVAFAREALVTGHEVVLSGRSGPESLATKVAALGHGASAATVGEAASLDYVLLAVPWPNVDDALRGLPAWNGRVLIDATNPFIEYSPKLVLADLGGKGASEVVAGLTPGARVVKAFNSIVTARFNEGPIKKWWAPRHLRLRGSPRADRIRQERDRRFRFRAGLPWRSRDRRPLAAGGRPARRSRSRRFWQPLSQCRKSSNACSGDQGLW